VIVRAVVFKIVAAVGLILVLVGTVFQPVPSYRALSGVLTGLGAAALIVSALANLPSLQAFFKRRQARRGANALVMTLAFAAILTIIQAISMRNSYRYDFTRNKRFTLSEPTQTLLAKLDGEIVIKAFVRQHTNRWRGAEALLEMYVHDGNNVRYELIDPDKKPQIAERYRARPGQAIVEYAGNPRKADELTEEDLTNALLFASRTVQKTVYFVFGHDERRIDDADGAGLTSARKGLENTGFLTREFSLVDVDSVPPDCSVLVVAGPKKEYLQSEVNKIDRYLELGGSALFLLDPRWPVSHLQTILDRYHVVADDGVLLDELVVVDTGTDVFDETFTKIRDYRRHPITRNFRSITIFPVARPLSIVPAEGDLAVSAQELALTGRSAWGETDLVGFRAGTAKRDTSDMPPPLAVAVVAERTNRFDPPSKRAPGPERRSKIVVIGDSDFITNHYYKLLGNSDFFLNSIEFLAEEEIVIPIRPKKSLGDGVFISAAEGRMILVLCLVLLPLTVASLGGYVLLRKRRNQ
jgi:ABC-type uncharacterized transport system involved in gliding motility auxiliary subunit